MNETTGPASPALDYVLGHRRSNWSGSSARRGSSSRSRARYFVAAGIAPGMRVLDVGSGAGDVALLLADLVGPGGEVVGVDRAAAALDTARAHCGARLE